MLSSLATCYLFLGGAGAGTLVALCLLECANAHRRYGFGSARTRLGRTYTGRAMGSLRVEGTERAGMMRYYESGYSGYEAEIAASRHARLGIARAFSLPTEFFSRAWLVCLVVLSLGVLCLMADLGRIDRLDGLLVHPEFSAITVGAYALSLALMCAGAFTIISLFDGVLPGERVVYALAAIGVASGAVSMVYTGVLLSGLASVLFWQTPLLPVLFAVSSFSCGIACVLLAAAFVDVRQSMVVSLANVARVDSVVLVLEILCLALYLAWGLLGEGTFSSAHALIAGDLRWMFWGGLVALGLILPLVMERFVGYGNYKTQLIWVAGAVLLGGFLLRWCVVGAAGYDASQQMLGQAMTVASGLI